MLGKLNKKTDTSGEIRRNSFLAREQKDAYKHASIPASSAVR